MKNLFILLLTSFICANVYSQKTFEVSDIVTITKLTKEQFEGKYNLKSIDDKKDKKGMVYKYQGISFMETDFHLFIREDKGRITEAVFLSNSPKRNHNFATLTYAIDRFTKSWEVIDNSTKKSIPFFTKDEFSNFFYDKDTGESKILETKSAKITSVIVGSKIIFLLTRDNLSIINSQN